MKELVSQQMRKIAPELDPLRIGTGWAPEGAVIKHTACPREMFQAVLRARPFDSEEECIQAVLSHRVQKGDAVFIRYEGPRASGCPPKKSRQSSPGGGSAGPRPRKYKSGTLRLFSELAAGPMKGAYLEYPD